MPGILKILQEHSQLYKYKKIKRFILDKNNEEEIDRLGEEFNGRETDTKGKIKYPDFITLDNKKIPLWEKIRHSFTVVDGFWSWATSALLIFFLGWLPLMLGSQEFQTSLLSYNLPKITSYIMTFAMVGMVLSAVTSLILLPPRPKRFGRLKNISMLLQWLLLPVTLIIFGNFPSLDAQMRLLLGKHLGFWVTEKVRKGD